MKYKLLLISVFTWLSFGAKSQIENDLAEKLFNFYITHATSDFEKLKGVRITAQSYYEEYATKQKQLKSTNNEWVYHYKFNDKFLKRYMLEWQYDKLIEDNLINKMCKLFAQIKAVDSKLESVAFINKTIGVHKIEVGYSKNVIGGFNKSLASFNYIEKQNKWELIFFGVLSDDILPKYPALKLMANKKYDDKLFIDVTTTSPTIPPNQNNITQQNPTLKKDTSIKTVNNNAKTDAINAGADALKQLNSLFKKDLDKEKQLEKENISRWLNKRFKGFKITRINGEKFKTSISADLKFDYNENLISGTFTESTEDETTKIEYYIKFYIEGYVVNYSANNPQIKLKIKSLISKKDFPSTALVKWNYNFDYTLYRIGIKNSYTTQIAVASEGTNPENFYLESY